MGGMAGSFEVAGLRVDHGSHRLHPATPARDPRRPAGPARATTFRPGPATAASGCSTAGWPSPCGPGTWSAGPRPAFAAARPRSTPPPARCAGPGRHLRRGGPGRARSAVLDHFYGPYARKLWDADPGGLAGELARRRVSASSPPTSPSASPGGRGPRAGVPVPAAGVRRLAEALAGAAADAGADLRLGLRGHVRPPRSGGGWSLTLDGGATLTPTWWVDRPRSRPWPEPWTRPRPTARWRPPAGCATGRWSCSTWSSTGPGGPSSTPTTSP